MADISKIRLSGTTYIIKDGNSLHTLDNTVTSGGTNAVKGSGIYDAITASTAAALESVAQAGYQTSGDVENAISGKLDTSTFETYSGDVETALSGKADTSDIPAVSGYADSVKYNSTSKYVEFYHGGTGGTKVFEFDASPFIVDGMVQNVEIKDVTISGESVTCLVISFNTDAGKQDINIPISDIFDASNYYTKTETDNRIDEKIVEAGGMTSGAVQSMIDENISGISNTLSAHTADTTIHVTSGDKTTWNAKQDALVSGTNIKTVGGESILGSGNITIPEGMTAHIGTGEDAETLIFEFN